MSDDYRNMGQTKASMDIAPPILTEVMELSGWASAMKHLALVIDVAADWLRKGGLAKQASLSPSGSAGVCLKVLPHVQLLNHFASLAFIAWKAVNYSTVLCASAQLFASLAPELPILSRQPPPALMLNLLGHAAQRISNHLQYDGSHFLSVLL